MELTQIIFVFLVGVGVLRIGIIIGEHNISKSKKIYRDLMLDWTIAMMRLQLNEHQLDHLMTELRERGMLPHGEIK